MVVSESETPRAALRSLKIFLCSLEAPLDLLQSRVKFVLCRLLGLLLRLALVHPQERQCLEPAHIGPEELSALLHMLKVALDQLVSHVVLLQEDEVDQVVDHRLLFNGELVALGRDSHGVASKLNDAHARDLSGEGCRGLAPLGLDAPALEVHLQERHLWLHQLLHEFFASTDSLNVRFGLLLFEASNLLAGLVALRRVK